MKTFFSRIKRVKPEDQITERLTRSLNLSNYPLAILIYSFSLSSISQDYS